MRVLYLNPCAQMGGAETSLVELLASIRFTEPTWDLILILGENGPLVEKAKALGVHVRVIPLPVAIGKLGDSGKRGRAGLLSGLFASLGYIRVLKRVIRTERPQLIHSTGFKMHVLSAWARPRGIPLIWHIHDYVQSRPLMSRLLRWHAGRCTSAIVNSRSVAADLRSALGSRVPVDCIYNAIDLARFSPVGARLDLDAVSHLPAPHEPTVRVGLIATFAWWKGHRVFLKALSLLPLELRVWGYIIGGPVYRAAGSQESMEALREEAINLGLEGRVGFTGHVDDSASAIRALDIVIHASTLPEPFGMVIAEAMGCAKPLVVSNAGGARELFDEEVEALSHQPGDAQVLAQQITRLVKDRALGARFGQAGRAKAERSFDRKRLGREVLRVYRGLGNGSTSDAFSVKESEVRSA